jgi:hypothetical protein
VVREERDGKHQKAESHCQRGPHFSLHISPPRTKSITANVPFPEGFSLFYAKAREFDHSIFVARVVLRGACPHVGAKIPVSEEAG